MTWTHCPVGEYQHAPRTSTAKTKRYLIICSCFSGSRCVESLLVPLVPDTPRAGGYERFFGLNESPFSLAPDPRFLFASASHSAALDQLAYAIERREPIVVVTGEIGTGKTLLCRAVLQRLPRKTFVSIVDDPLLGPDDLLKQLLRDFGVISKDRSTAAETSRHDLVQALTGFLRSLAAIHAHAVVIIDEAQHLQPAVLEQIRLLSNVDDERGTLLQIVLVGQQDMEPMLSRPELRQIQQRVARRFRLERLTPDEVQHYIEHRLDRARTGGGASNVPGAAELARALADWDGERPSVTFDPTAIAAIARLSGGLPRVINLLCDRALEAAFAAGTRVVDTTAVQAAARALGMETDEGFWTPPAGEAPQPGEAPPQPEDIAAEEVAPATVPVADATTAAVVTGQTHTPSGPRRSVVVAATLVVVVAAIWLGLRFAAARRESAAHQENRPAPISAAPAPVRPEERPEPAAPAPAATAPTPSVTPAPAVPNTATPMGSTAAVPPAPARSEGAPPDHRTVPAPQSQQTAPSGAPSRQNAAATGTGYEIIVASFRTEARATAVQTEIAALGVPARRRVIGDWQQVLCGPFPSRSAAEQAQDTLNRAGYTGTQVVLPQR